LPSSSAERPHRPSLAGEIVVFTGKLTSLGRKDARALVVREGGATADEVSSRVTMLVVGDEGFGSDGSAASREISNKLKKAEELNAQGAAAVRVVSESDFCRLVGVEAPDDLRRQYHSMRDLLARYRGLREDHVRYLVQYGIIRPVARTHADTFVEFRDVAVIKQANDELESGASFRAVVRTLLAAREGQLALDFRLDASPAKIIALPMGGPGGPRRPASQDGLQPISPRDTQLAEEYFRAGSALDDGDQSMVERAASAYRKALQHDPYLVAALINLANIHYGRDELAEAQALYERAIGLEPDVFEAHFNLGNIYHDLGRFGEAQNCYLEALRLNPGYADAHFYLAVTYEKLGQSAEARPHWQAYRQLAPHGEWAELAREFSE
jgi:tetratricopeptide (TPR) repeat protein